jgi:hypothetical protein
MMRGRRQPALATLVAFAAMLFAFATTAHAVCPAVPNDTFAFINAGSDTCPADPSVRWTAAAATFDCGFFAENDKSINCSGDDATCVSLCRAATDIWNTDLAGRFRFNETSQPVTFCDTEDGIISVGGTTTLCDGSNYGNNVLAVTLSIFFSSGPQAGELIDANITVNQRFNFTQKSFQATLAHEFGHSFGLSHPDQCGEDFNVLMRSASLFASSDPCFVLDPTQADINGAVRIYPVVGPTPTPTPTAAVCGDADSSGAITVTDGVNVLRAAAELSSACTLARCDVDGNGSITVTDGVNVLRAAAGLSFTANCP